MKWYEFIHQSIRSSSQTTTPDFITSSKDVHSVWNLDTWNHLVRPRIPSSSHPRARSRSDTFNSDKICLMFLPTTCFLTMSAVDGGPPHTLIDSVNQQKLVFYGDILLLSLLACFILANILQNWPWHSSPLTYRHSFSGHSSEKGEPQKPTHGQDLDPPPQYSPSPQYSEPRLKAIFRGLTRSLFLHHHIISGVSFGKMLIVCIYSSILLCLTFYKSNPFTDPKRAGLVAISQIPFVLVLATRNVLRIATGFGYEQVLATRLTWVT